MSRYEIRPIGVYDRTLEQLVTIDMVDAWRFYEEWRAAGNQPDPLPIVVPAPLTAEDLAARAELAARAAMRGTLRADPTVDFLRTHTPAECAAWVNANVTDLATAKSVLSKLAMVVAYFARERLLD